MNEQEKQWAREFDVWVFSPSPNYPIKSVHEAKIAYLAAKQSSQSIIDEMAKRIEELEARQVPEGWKLVPVEPTDNGVGGMVNAGAIALKQHDDTPFMENRTGIAKFVYKAMLSASPNYKEPT